MRHGLTPRALSAAELAQAYTLVGLCHENISLDRWRRHVSAGGRPGPKTWHALRDERGYMHAVYAHRIENDLTWGRTLVVSDLLAPGPGWRATLQALDDCARELAGELECGMLRVLFDPERSAPDDVRLRDHLTAAGYFDNGPWMALQILAPAR